MLLRQRRHPWPPAILDLRHARSPAAEGWKRRKLRARRTRRPASSRNMVVLADKGKGFWCRIHDGRLLTPTTYAALPSTASVAFVAIPFGALALGKAGEGDEEEFLLRHGMRIVPPCQCRGLLPLASGLPPGSWLLYELGLNS